MVMVSSWCGGGKTSAPGKGSIFGCTLVCFGSHTGWCRAESEVITVEVAQSDAGTCRGEVETGAVWSHEKPMNN